MGTPRSSPRPVLRTSKDRPRVSAVRMLRISRSTNAFFVMLARHMCSGSPVLADCACTNSSADCVPSPIGSVPDTYSSPALPTFSISSSTGMARRASRACHALRMSRCTRPPLARPIVAMGSPVAKWATWSTSMLV